MKLSNMFSRLSDRARIMMLASAIIAGGTALNTAWEAATFDLQHKDDGASYSDTLKTAAAGGALGSAMACTGCFLAAFGMRKP